MLGLAFIAVVASADPGSFATNIGNRTAWWWWWRMVAMVVQTLSSKLGLVTRSSLPELIRDGA